MSGEIEAGSRRAKAAGALLRIFATVDGMLLRQILEEDVLRPLSAIDPTTGACVGHDAMLLAEGQKILARKLLDLADVDAPKL